jgi:3',5'-cyclic AMP phosphodiesterase CpdA
MKFSRRQFIGMMGAASLAGCARTKDLYQSTKQAVSNVKVPKIGGGSGPFTFATIGDLHILDARSTSIVNRAANMINDMEDVQFTAVLGDLASDGELVELRLAKQSLGRLTNPYLCVPGNHDAHVYSEDMFGNYRSEFDETHWREDDTGWLFIGLDTCEGNKSDVTVRKDQIQFLTKVAERTNANRPIAILGHHPFNPNTKAYRVANADEVLEIFSGHNLKLVAAGHYHGNQEETLNGTLFTTTACCSSTRNNFDDTTSKGFRLFHVDAGENITTEYVEVQA